MFLDLPTINKFKKFRQQKKFAQGLKIFFSITFQMILGKKKHFSSKKVQNCFVLEGLRPSIPPVFVTQSNLGGVLPASLFLNQIHKNFRLYTKCIQ